MRTLRAETADAIASDLNRASSRQIQGDLATVAMEEPSDAELAAQAATTNEVPQTFYRYMRADRTGNQKFMACVTLQTDEGPKKYSTHFDDGNEKYESSIIIDPQPVYTLRLSQLTASRNGVYHCTDKDNEIYVDTYYWGLPGGVYVLHQSFSNAGWTSSKLQWAFEMELIDA